MIRGIRRRFIRIALAVLALAIRFGLPLLAVFFIWRVARKYRAGGKWQTDSKEPEFDGPVYNVDYKIVEDEKEE